MSRTTLAAILILIGISQGAHIDQSAPLRGPPIVEKAPLLLNSFLPASMQIIAHLTDLMKYELRPSTGSTTSTTIRPTPQHKPAIYSPKDPLGPAAYFARGSSYQANPVELSGQEADYKNVDAGVGVGGENARAKFLRAPQDSIDLELDLLGQGPISLLKQVNKLDDYDFVDDDDKVLRFSENYDDSDFRNYVIGKKKIPPTRAYVTLLSLYDLLNKESKKLQLNKYGGYAQEVLQVLAETSSGTAAVQLQTVLSKVVTRRDSKDQAIIKKIDTLLKDLEQTDSYINDALRYIPPLQFTL